MRAREFISLLGGAAAAWPLFAHAQERPKPLRIGTVSLNRRASAQRVAFEQRLRELGYIEGQNLVIEYINAPDRPDRIDEAARELVQRNVDIIVLENHITLKSVMSATSTFRSSSSRPVSTPWPWCRGEHRATGREHHRLLRSPPKPWKNRSDCSLRLFRKDPIGCGLGSRFRARHSRQERDRDCVAVGTRALRLAALPTISCRPFEALPRRRADGPRCAPFFSPKPGAYPALALATWPADDVRSGIYADTAGLMSYGPDLDLSAGRRLCRPNSRGTEPADLH